METRQARPLHAAIRLFGLAASLHLASAMPAAAQQPGTSPVKIYVMMGESNMEGHGEISPAGTQGTLEYITAPANDPGGIYQFLKDGAAWAERADVWMHYERLGTTAPRIGNLMPGYGATSANTTIGPELGFGHKVGAALGNQVLIVKASWGGTNLGNDFLSPSSGPYPEPRVPGDKGYYYQQTLRLLQDAISKLGVYFPDYNGQGYEIAGICWHQGWNDRVIPAFSTAYQASGVQYRFLETSGNSGGTSSDWQDSPVLRLVVCRILAGNGVGADLFRVRVVADRRRRGHRHRVELVADVHRRDRPGSHPRQTRFPEPTQYRHRHRSRAGRELARRQAGRGRCRCGGHPPFVERPAGTREGRPDPSRWRAFRYAVRGRDRVHAGQRESQGGFGHQSYKLREVDSDTCIT